MITLSRFLIVSTAVTLLVPGLAAAKDGAHELESSPKASVSASSTPEHEGGSGKVARMNDASSSVKIEGAVFCSKFDTATGTVNTETGARFSKLNEDFAARKVKISSELDDTAAKIAHNRADADTRLNEKLSALDSKATSTEQKTAVADFKASVHAAVLARRTAVDKANDTFRSGVQAAVSARQTQLAAAAAAYKSAVAAALANAKASCAAKTDPQTVRANLKAALAAAHTALETARQSASKNNAGLDALKAARKAAIEKANADFHAAITAALAKLKAALGVKVSPTATAAPATAKPVTP